MKTTRIPLKKYGTKNVKIPRWMSCEWKFYNWNVVKMYSFVCSSVVNREISCSKNACFATKRILIKLNISHTTIKLCICSVLYLCQKWILSRQYFWMFNVQAVPKIPFLHSTVPLRLQPNIKFAVPVLNGISKSLINKIIFTIIHQPVGTESATTIHTLCTWHFYWLKQAQRHAHHVSHRL